MSKNKKNRVEAPVSVEQISEELVVVETQIEQTEPEDEMPFGPDAEGTIIPTPELEVEQTEEQQKGYKVVRVDQIQNLQVGEMYKREDKKNCKIWTVVLKEEGKMLVSSSPKNIHNPRKEADMDVVVIELV